MLIFLLCDILYLQILWFYRMNQPSIKKIPPDFILYHFFFFFRQESRSMLCGLTES
jgi:hypothetical protein